MEVKGSLCGGREVEEALDREHTLTCSVSSIARATRPSNAAAGNGRVAIRLPANLQAHMRRAISQKV